MKALEEAGTADAARLTMSRGQSPAHRLETDRLFVCDPVCVQPFGHNVSALNYFGTAFASEFPHAVSLCCIDLPQAVSERYGFTPFYHYYYQEFMPVDAGTEARIDGDETLYVDHLEGLATADARRLLADFSIDAGDSMLFPSLDFYGVIGLLNALRDVPPNEAPRIFLRFIGVMESASHAYRDPERELTNRLSKALRRGLRISVSAETPRLADRLALMLFTPVAVTPYPTVAPVSPVPTQGPFTCFCPGSARLDKGFLLLHQLFFAVRRRDPSMAVHFVIQDLPAAQSLSHQSYISALYAIPGVDLLPAQIDEAEMISRYQAASVVLLPYEKDVYRFRGSAAMMESVCFGRPVIALEGSAFCDQIEYYGLGKVVQTVDAMVDAIFEMMREPPDKLTVQAMQGRFRFTSDASDAYTRWFTNAT